LLKRPAISAYCPAGIRLKNDIDIPEKLYYIFLLKNSFLSLFYHPHFQKQVFTLITNVVRLGRGKKRGKTVRRHSG
jgi:hypothetical protein